MNDNPEEESDDGYDSDLFENPEKAAEFKCPICTCIAKDPIETEPCGHLYCKGCLQSHLNVNSVSDLNNDTPSYCPSCREPIQETSRSKFVERQILKLRVKCANHSIGCTWKGELHYFKSHLRKQCPFVTVTCIHCKGKPYMRGKEEQHMNECLEYPVECTLCQSKIKRKFIKEHAEKLCPCLSFACPNACGQQIKQSLLSTHMEKECIYRRVHCFYRCYGCAETPKHCDLQLHLSQHQVLHLELKIMYLERVAQSTELLSISNTTGLFPGISGLYERQQKPHLARPVWRNKNKETYLVRYDAVLRGWVLDRKAFDGDIVALRYGSHPTPTAKQLEPQHILDLEQTLSGQDVAVDMDLNDNNEGKEAAKDDEKKSIASTKKRGMFCDGAWHIKGNVENSRIKVQGYTEREFDLEWEFRSLAARMRRERSGVQHVTAAVMDHNGANKGQRDAIGCVCGKGLMKTKDCVYNNGNKDWNSICNVCENKVLKGVEFWHCPAMRMTRQHLDGYDLCLSCGEARRQTQDGHTPTCDCGSKLVAMMSFNVYAQATGVRCNVCASVTNGAIWHCPKNYNKTHERGFDLCISCGKTYSA
eukprot:523300_1